MYHLLMGFDWNDSSDSLPSERVFEYTDEELVDVFEPDGEFDVSKISSIPALFSNEYDSRNPQPVHFGVIHTVRRRGRSVNFRYTLDRSVPTITNQELTSLAGDLDIQDFEFSRTHWAIKDVDLYKVLLRYQFPNRIDPKVFSFDETIGVDENLISVMMPFDKSFDKVFKSLKMVADELNMECLRADDIWNHPAIIQDVFDLICRSRVVVSDCTRRNPNVFYETGIAHTLGRDVILITQSPDDIPFDLTHLRYVPYLNNAEGLRKLRAQLTSKLKEV